MMLFNKDKPYSLAFGRATVLLPVMDETESLTKTVEIIEQECGLDVQEYLFLVCDRTKQESIDICNGFVESTNNRFRLIRQSLPFLGGAVRDGFNAAKGSHVVMMASDLETNPHDVKEMISLVKKKPNAIVTASRWISGIQFEGYSPVKLVANYIFQQIFRIVYFTNLSDLTYGYRIFPTDLVQSIRWEQLRHDFLFETLIKPLRLGVEVVEIPTRWQARVEGQSQNTFFRNFYYFWIGIKVRFTPKSRILLPIHPEEDV
jgi:hypothetical protein